jgi:Skp family chaperone for outer membrane proteins
MKKITFLALSLVFTAFISATAFGQGASSAPAPPQKIGWINSSAWGAEEGGITKYVNAAKALNNEFRPKQAQLEELDKKIKAIAEDLRKMSSNPAVPVDQRAAAAKQAEGEKLQREFEFMQKNAQADFERRSAEVLGPIEEEINAALREFAKVNNYTIILDLAALAQTGAILAFDPAADITKTFIAYFNGRTGGTATRPPTR